MENPLISIKKQFEYYKQLGNKTIDLLTEEQLFWQFNGESNSIAILIRHMEGNMLSRWTNFLTEDGEKDWRERDSEFENIHETREQLLDRWENGWKCLFAALDALTVEDLSKEVYIRNQGQTALDAIHRQLAHYPYHVGQIVFVGKMLCNEHWKSLSIPRAASKSYNEEKFAQPKHREHFTDEYIRKEKEIGD